MSREVSGVIGGSLKGNLLRGINGWCCLHIEGVILACLAPSVFSLSRQRAPNPNGGIYQGEEVVVRLVKKAGNNFVICLISGVAQQCLPFPADRCENLRYPWGAASAL